MRTCFLTLFVVLLALGSSYTQKIEVIKYPELASLIDDNKNEVAVFNFWATWCRPCIKELPYFENINAQYSRQGVKVFLISFDFVEELNGKVKNFINKRGLKSDVKLLDETDYNAFIDKIDPSWSGAIPATLIVDNKNNRKLFFEKEFEEEEELNNIIKDIIN